MADKIFTFNNKIGDFDGRVAYIPDTLSSFSALGGTISDINLSGQDYRLHIFNSDDDFEVTSIGTGNEIIDVIVVAGGSSGGRGQFNVCFAAGGGAGEVIYATFSSSDFSITTYSAVVGLGGVFVTDNVPMKPGGTSSFFGLTAIGGKDSGVNGKGGSSGNGLYVGGVRSTFWSGGGAGDQENGTNGGTTAGSSAGGDGRDLSLIVGTAIGDDGWFAGGGAGFAGGSLTDAYGGKGGGGSVLRSSGSAVFVPPILNTGSGGAYTDGADGVIIVRYTI